VVLASIASEGSIDMTRANRSQTNLRAAEAVTYDVRSLGGLRQELLFDERREDGVTARSIEIPQAARLVAREAEIGHLDELHSNSRQHSAIDIPIGWHRRSFVKVITRP
jgi:hypothetical protein